MSPPDGPHDAERRWSDAARSEWVQETQVVARGRSLIHAVLLVALATASQIIIYDGSGSNGRKKLEMRTAANSTVAFSPPKPWQMDQGIYFDVTGGAPGMLIVFEPIPD